MAEITPELVQREKSLNEQILPHVAEIRRLSFELNQSQTKLAAMEMELSGVRSEIMEEFLSQHLNERALSYTFFEDAGEYFVEVIANEGGEEEYEAIRKFANLIDLNRLPLFYLISYIGEGLPFLKE